MLTIIVKNTKHIVCYIIQRVNFIIHPIYDTWRLLQPIVHEQHCPRLFSELDFPLARNTKKPVPIKEIGTGFHPAARHLAQLPARGATARAIANCYSSTL